MTLEQIEVILAIVDSGSFRAAAEKLNRSQPALSAAVKNLEEEFDLQIFDRSEYRPKLTEAGQAFSSVARSLMSASRYTTRVARELGTHKAETRLRVSTDPLVSAEVLEILAHECSRPTYPVTLIIEKSILDSSVEKLVGGSIDLAIAPQVKEDDRIETISLETVSLVGAVSRKLLQEKRKATKEFLNSTAQIFAYDINQNEDESHLPGATQGSTHQRIFVPDHATKLKLIQNGLGWGRISKKELKESEDLVLIEPAVLSHLSLNICLMRPRYRPLGPLARSIWSVFEKRQAKK